MMSFLRRASFVAALALPAFGQVRVLVTQGGNDAAVTAGGAVKTDASATTQPMSAASLPLPAGASTSAKQPALGTAGSASADVITIQGVASMTKLLVTPDSVALPANQSTNVAQVAGTATDTNSGVKSAGTIRVVLATDQPALTNKLLVTPDSVALPANQSVNVSQVSGTTADTNSGAKSAGTLRVVLATDQPALTNKLLVTPDSVALPANQSVNVSQVNGVTTLMGNGVTGTGSQRVTIASDNTAFSVNAAATLSAETTKVIGTVRNLGNGGAIMDAATGAAPPANAPLMAGLGSGATGGFLIGVPVCDTPYSGQITTGTTTLLITGVSGRHVRICGGMVLSVAANNVAIVSGTGATCATGTGAIVGTTSGTGWNLQAGSGMTFGNGLGMMLRTVATGDSVCAITSAATPTNINFSYAIY